LGRAGVDFCMLCLVVCPQAVHDNRDLSQAQSIIQIFQILGS
jgi:hypothetical protein